MKKQNDDEIQSRREFFRNAAKAALPILGAIVLTQTSLLTKAAEIPMTCENTCSAHCAGNCHGQCLDTCRGRCTDTCSGTCQNTCKFTCSGSCKHGSQY